MYLHCVRGSICQTRMFNRFTIICYNLKWSEDLDFSFIPFKIFIKITAN